MKNKIYLHEPAKLSINDNLIQKEIKRNNLVIGNNLDNFRNKIVQINKSKF